MIRQAESKDALDIERLYRILLSDNMNIKVREDRIEEIKNTPNSFLFVYEEDGRIIATAHLHLCLDAVMENRPFGLIERVVVDSRRQNNGYGKKLMVYIESLCRDLKCEKIILLSNSKRIAAHSFYKKLGYDGEGSKGFKKYLE